MPIYRSDHLLIFDVSRVDSCVQNKDRQSIAKEKEDVGAKCNKAPNKKMDKLVTPTAQTTVRIKTVKGFAYNYSNPNNLLGEGGFGIVWKGFRLSDDLPVAIKKLKKFVSNEWEIPEIVSNQFLLKMFSHFQLEDNFYVINELCDGDLVQLLKTVQRFPLEQMSTISFQLSRGYMVLNTAGIVHRDIKPGNILFKRIDDHGIQLKIGDYGCGKVFDQYLATHTVLGTPRYVAPEVYDGKYDERADMWSLGLVLYECYFGKVDVEFFGKITGKEEALLAVVNLPPTNDKALDNMLKNTIQPNAENRIKAVQFYDHIFHKNVNNKALVKIV